MNRQHKEEETDNLYEKYADTYKHPSVIAIPHTKTKRNELCPCGSGKKYKKCCMNVDA